jgi:hypothetical protein
MLVPDVHAADASTDLRIFDQPSRVSIPRFFKIPGSSLGIGPCDGVGRFHTRIVRFTIQCDPIDFSANPLPLYSGRVAKSVISQAWLAGSISCAARAAINFLTRMQK